ncbi:glycerate kinase [Staphylococcus chromogenes]|nr:glycerate kinase [Staphylococcus chromogenes]
MNILIAPDSFKGTATAHQACEFIAAGIRSVAPEATITVVPLADGGEGTASCFAGDVVTLPTTDAAGRLTEASYVFDDGTESGLPQAFIDVAAASGLPAVADHPVPMTGDTYGTGVLIADAIAKGAQRITLGLGGSATIDGGTGILVALGAPAMNAEGHPLRQGGAALVDFDHFDTAQLNIPAAAAEWVLLTDVSAPATGPHGAAHVFGPQKGASAADIAILDQALETLCDKCGIDPGRPGFGAAGGLPIAITALSTILHGSESHVHVMPGAPVIAESVGLPELLQQADVVITGEGSFDQQSSLGKVTGMVLDLAASHNKKAFVVAGKLAQQPASPAVGVEMIANSDVEKQLFEAGARIARSW